ncbi:tetraspanin-9-like [Ylistrum balloti]|uniref:tetraspanin-9-like n=1 Tax=Ylistrum balloti TaxID=509963 RepID=UPI002905F126|nr:tetraspanin-9-like [Ylistrum balloti]
MNILGKIGRVFLIVLNSLFLILGIAAFIGGIVFYNNSGATGPNVAEVMNQITIGNFTLANLVKLIAGLFIAVGVISVIVAVVGIIGASKQQRALLIIYAVVVIIVIIMELVIAGGVSQMKNDLNSTVKRRMLELLRPYEGNQGGALTSAWNWLFMTFDCCGVNPLIQTNDMIYTFWWQNFNRGVDQIPGFCCRDANPQNAQFNARQACTIAPTPLNSFVDRGCFDVMYQILNKYNVEAIIGCILFLLVEIAAFVFAVLMARQIGRNASKKNIT